MRRRMVSLAAMAMMMSTGAWAEPSVYGGGFSGGGAQSKQNRKMIITLRQQVNRMQEEIDGLRRVVEGLNQQINRMQRQSKASASGIDPESFRRLQQRVAALEKRPISKQRSAARKSTETPAKSTAATPKKKAEKTPSTSAESKLEKASSKALFSRGVRLVNAKRYSEAKQRFDILKKRNYKPASTQFYLGEIAYRTGKYDDAIRYYQKSAELNENAAYMDRLLLHTGIALEKSGDKEQARNFFQAIVDGYPGTSSAAVAKRHLK